jgi:prolyl-tRNA synthetase
MRQKTLFVQTYREAPSEAEVISHQLMLRAGYIRQLAAGIYAYLPLGLRVLRKLEQIIRKEMDRAGAQELLMPAMQPIELWKQSGRDSLYGPELIRLHDRHDREFALGPTHEEVVTTLVRSEINSHRKLPITLYQIQTKYRDERRPRYGLLRGREFLMKDAYSFDMDWEGLDRSYWKMFEAYKRIFNRSGLNYRAVEADAGSIGGEGGTHEFMALADIGEDTIVSCTHCDYAANVEKAESGTAINQQPESQITPSIKTMIYKVDGNLVAVLVRGDHEVNEIKIKNALNAEFIEIADAETVKQTTGVPFGSTEPIGLTVPILVDLAIVNYNQMRTHTGDFRNAMEGDGCPRCNDGSLQFYKGIEIGHVFKLGTKYSEKLKATFLDQTGKEQFLIMGCYGIGVSRILSAIVEQNNDEFGMKWPMAVAPFQVHIIPVSVNDELQMRIAEQLYDRLLSSGFEVLIDDRDERPGVKFKDSDLIGIPIRIVVGKQAGQGYVEFKQRELEEKETIKIEDVFDKVKVIVGADFKL